VKFTHGILLQLFMTVACQAQCLVPAVVGSGFNQQYVIACLCFLASRFSCLLVHCGYLELFEIYA
jgi:hypothetical protein